MRTYCVATAIIADHAKYYVAKRAATKKIEPGVWEFITGFVEDHEAAEDTIVREIAEEINAAGTIVRELDVIRMLKQEERWIVVPFVVCVANPDIKTDPSEHSEGRRVTWNQLEHFPTGTFRYDLDQIKSVLKMAPEAASSSGDVCQ